MPKIDPAKQQPIAGMITYGLIQTATPHSRPWPMALKSTLCTRCSGWVICRCRSQMAVKMRRPVPTPLADQIRDPAPDLQAAHNLAEEVQLALVGIRQEYRPVISARNQFAKIRHHLATIADAQRECVAAGEKLGKLVASSLQPGF